RHEFVRPARTRRPIRQDPNRACPAGPRAGELRLGYNGVCPAHSGDTAIERRCGGACVPASSRHLLWLRESGWQVATELRRYRLRALRRYVMTCILAARWMRLENPLNSFGNWSPPATAGEAAVNDEMDRRPMRPPQRRLHAELDAYGVAIAGRSRPGAAVRWAADRFHAAGWLS